MPKQLRDRKLASQDGHIDGIEDRAVRIKASRLQAKLEQSNKSLKEAVQLARGFERQKLSRRQKQAEKEPRTLLRLREEVIILRELDPSKTAKDYLFKQLVKTKRIRGSLAFIALYGENPKLATTKSVAEANVLGRLFKSNPVKEVLPVIMQSIRDILNLEDNNSTAKDPATPNSGDTKHEPPKSMEVEEEFVGFSNAQKPSPANQRGKLLEGVIPDELGHNAEPLLSDSDGEPHDLRAYADLIGSSSADEIEDAPDDDVRRTASTAKQMDQQVPTPSSSEVDESHIVVPQPQSRPPQQSLMSEKISHTAFLPSLSMGGYYSGSESDAADEDTFDQERGPAVPEVRKNRRGQRARREIAEKKYGNNAKHLLKQPSANETLSYKNRNAGWDPRQGAVDGQQGRRFIKGRGGSGAARSDRVPPGANVDAINPNRARERKSMTATNGHDTAAGASSAKRKVEAPLHPSWEAARKKKKETGSTSFSGKKITFD